MYVTADLSIQVSRAIDEAQSSHGIVCIPASVSTRSLDSAFFVTLSIISSISIYVCPVLRNFMWIKMTETFSSAKAYVSAYLDQQIKAVLYF